MRARKRGFTLMEMVVVITILAVVSLAVFSFIGMGTRIYVDAAERDQLLSEARFVVERLSRELRNAVPNSIRTRQANANNSHCIEFVPAKWSGYYLDVPVAPEPAASEVKVLTLSGGSDSYNFVNGDRLLVYPISSVNVYNSTALPRAQYPIAGVTGPDADNLMTISLASSIQFAADSPSSRFYIGGQPVAYCFWREGGESDVWLYRYQGYGYLSSPTNSNTNIGLIKASLASLMAKDVQPYSLVTAEDELPFKVRPATLTRNALVQIRLRFMLNEEIVTYHYEVQVPNVP
ncbi:type II secretion system protein [Bowmanella yangjiangensis]|uniref:Type II secretion system protein n=1 Tax=Bowmanella yangjiangensis TaxID=2811230 RepID=A0ABS3CSN2_9ALTE|nr:type II secretion system protein [Bowmanella yangjiangensis]MBN7819295.1 type II secretion system protein [Bowmanella yangjiangensis]